MKSSSSLSTNKTKKSKIKTVKFADTDNNDNVISDTTNDNENGNNNDKRSTSLFILFPDGSDKNISLLLTDTMTGFDLMLIVKDMKYLYVQDVDKIVIYLHRKRSISTISNSNDVVYNNSSNSNITNSQIVTNDERILIHKDSLIISYGFQNNDIIEVVINVDANINSINNSDRLRSLNYMEFVRDVHPEHLSRNISIHTDIRIRFGPNSSGLILFTPGLVDKEAIRSFVPIASDKFKDEDFINQHFTVEEKVCEEKETINPESLVCESCRFRHSKVFVNCEVCGTKNTHGMLSPKNRTPKKIVKIEDDETEKQRKVDVESTKEKELYPFIIPGDMCLQLGSAANAKARGFKQWTMKKFQSRIHLLELTEKTRNVDSLIERLESARYSFNGINDGYVNGDDDSWQRYTSVEPIECRIDLSDEYDIFSSLSDDEAIITLKPYEQLKHNQTYIIYLGNSIPVVPSSLESLVTAYNASHVCEDKLFLFTTSYE